ncbi:hypothetical protein PIN31009_01671 [Pandoraea iniqua]|uniref:Lipoprotein n=2 Tax=Pandoraea iniqua TaxID=2508288 RepID=A0A5E4U7P6_9BURK|nr:hypothetical protein [Pandoraea iniqua]VVD91887.1 hypothetical protein PIN31009_01671 [Pandoraea iniqua]VVD96077.1 hypothetical protein PIN31115_01853 [Pandoraea iniqua]
MAGHAVGTDEAARYTRVSQSGQTNTMKKLAKIAMLLSSGMLTLSLSACGTSAPLFTSDGRPTQQIQCSAASSGDCDQRARTQCAGKNYDVLTRDVSGNVANLVIACQAN